MSGGGTGPAGEPLLLARGIRQRLRGREVLAGCDFALAPGVSALLGPNGAGKSVLLRALAGIVPATAGGVLLEGHAADPDRLRRAVAYVPQFPGAHPRLSVRGHLERAALWAGQPRGAVAAVLERTGLAAEARRPAGRLEAAGRRRLAVAAALVRHCRVLCFDEPTADLDPEERAAFWSEVAALEPVAAGVAVVVTTHLFDEVAAHAAHALVLWEGRVVFAGTVAELAIRARGRTWRLPPDAELPPGWVAAGLEADGALAALAAAEPAPAAPPVPGAVPRAPTPLDGYLAVTGGLPA